MNPQWTDAENWIDLLDHAWYGIVLIVIAAVPTWAARRNHQAIKRVGEQTSAVVGQVINGHGGENQPGLRDDLDRMSGALTSVADDLRGLRSDLSDQRESNRDHIAELRADLAHHRKETAHRFDEIHRRLDGSQ